MPTRLPSLRASKTNQVQQWSRILQISCSRMLSSTMHKTDNKKKKRKGKKEGWGRLNSKKKERKKKKKMINISPECTHAHTLFTPLQSMLQTNARHTFTTVYHLLFLSFFGSSLLNCICLLFKVHTVSTKIIPSATFWSVPK